MAASLLFFITDSDKSENSTVFLFFWLLLAVSLDRSSDFLFLMAAPVLLRSTGWWSEAVYGGEGGSEAEVRGEEEQVETGEEGGRERGVAGVGGWRGLATVVTCCVGNKGEGAPETFSTLTPLLTRDRGGRQT